MRWLALITITTMLTLASMTTALVPMSKITEGIWVGNQVAAADLSALAAANITGVLNVAWDLDIEYPSSEYIGDVSTDNEHLRLEYNKVGLVDGEGNTLFQLAAAVFQLRQLVSKRTLEAKDADTFPNPPSAVLLHCHSGMSRSVTVMALYLHFTEPGKWASYDDTLKFVMDQRGSTTLPAAALVTAANALVHIDIFSPYGGL